MDAGLFLQIFMIITATAMVYILLLWLIPKGNMLHESLHIPLYWWKVKRSSLEGMHVEKRQFGKNSNQYLLFCQPLQHSRDRKLAILYHHGGGWQLGKPEMFQNNAHVFVTEGYTVFMPSYRKTPFHSYPEIREDISLGLQKAIAILDEQGRSDTRLILGGMSAGGNLAALMAMDHDSLLEAGIDSGRIAGLMLFGAPLNLDKMPPSPVVTWYAGKRGSEQFRKASPLSFLHPEWQLPVFCVHGKRDGLVPFDCYSSFAECLDETQKAAWKQIILDDGTHLDAGRWSIGDQALKIQIYKWLEEREKANG